VEDGVGEAEEFDACTFTFSSFAMLMTATVGGHILNSYSSTLVLK
jgi:hypothetical protein